MVIPANARTQPADYPHEGRQLAADMPRHSATVLEVGTVEVEDGMNAFIDHLEPAVRETMLECRRNCMPQVDALIAAGWRYELPEVVNRKEGDPPSTLDSEPWQWYWRRPPRRPGSKGMKFWSTSMAYNALLSQEMKKP